MPFYYFDIETTGRDENEHKIITIQYQELDRYTFKPKGNLEILKEWEKSERDIIQEFIKTKLSDPYEFSFAMIGFNLRFDHNFLLSRAKINKLPESDILKRPFIDLFPCAIMMNKGQFRGAKLELITQKSEGGSVVPEYYSKKNFDKIESYIEKEADEFVKLAVWLLGEMPQLLEKYRQSWKSKS